MRIRKALTGLLAAAGVLATLLLPAAGANAEDVSYYPQTVLNASGTAVGEARFNWFDSGMGQVTDYAAPVTFTYSIDFINTSSQSYTVKNISAGNSAHIYAEPAGGTTNWEQPISVSVSASQLTVPAGGTASVSFSLSYARPNVMRVNSYGGVSGFGYVIDANYTDAAGKPQSFTAYAAIGSAVPWNPNAGLYGQNPSNEALNLFLYNECAENDAYASVTVCGTWLSLQTGVFGSFQEGAGTSSTAPLPPIVKPTTPTGTGVTVIPNGSSSFGDTSSGKGVLREGGEGGAALRTSVAPYEGTSLHGEVCMAPAAPLAAVIVTLLIVLLLGVFTLIWFEHRKQLRADVRAADGSVKNLTVFQIDTLWKKLKGKTP